MKPAFLIPSAILAFTTVTQCFSQQTHSTKQGEAEAVVIKLYKQIVLRKPLGLPQRKELDAIGPSLSQDLIERIRVAEECETDYFRQYPYDPEHPIKPPFAWMETGLFSGGNELANPSRFSIRHALRHKDGSYEVEVKLAYKETFETYGRPPDPKDTFDWDVIAFVVWDGHRFAVNDVLWAKFHPSDKEIRLSDLLSMGCQDGKWVDYQDK
jgi:hypothetical protein